MITIRNYIQPTSLEEAYTLLMKNRNNHILGGNLWVKMGEKTIMNAIDLSKLSLDKIEEDEEKFVMGCMCSLRDLEIHPSLNEHFDGSFKEALRHIVGVQFRNTATLGGSVFPRFGFSDVLTILAAMDCEIELYHEGILPIKEFIDSKIMKDILVHVIVKKDQRKVVYKTQRITETDFGIINCALALKDNDYTVVFSATPYKAQIIDNVKLVDPNNEEEVENFINKVVEQVRFDSNMRGSAEYREALARVLLKRALADVHK